MGDMVFHYCVQVRLVDDREHLVGTLDGVRDEARVLDDENLILLNTSDVVSAALEYGPEGQIQLQPENVLDH